VPIKLRDYQEHTITALLNPPEDVTRSLAVLPTGSGKTIIFTALLDRVLRNGERALVLAHREELLTQARDKIAFAAPSLHVEIEQAASFASRTHPTSSFFEGRERSVVVGSMQTLRGKHLKEWPSDAFRIVILDEAHHATSAAYVEILTHFGCLDDFTRLVGVTSTPKRTDGIGLGAIFQEIAVEYGIRDMIRSGYLVPIRAWQVQTSIDLRSVKTTAGDYAIGELEKTVNTEKRNYEIVSAYEQYASDMQSVVFLRGRPAQSRRRRGLHSTRRRGRARLGRDGERSSCGGARPLPSRRDARSDELRHPHRRLGRTANTVHHPRPPHEKRTALHANGRARPALASGQGSHGRH
jgi:superfamily II DNA or RNA helicase